HHLHSAAGRRGSARGRGARGPREPRADAVDRVGALRGEHGRDRTRRADLAGGGRRARRVSLLARGGLLLGLPARPHGTGCIVAVLNALAQIAPLAVSGSIVIAIAVAGGVALIVVLLRRVRYARLGG